MPDFARSTRSTLCVATGSGIRRARGQRGAVRVPRDEADVGEGRRASRPSPQVERLRDAAGGSLGLLRGPVSPNERLSQNPLVFFFRDAASASKTVPLLFAAASFVFLRARGRTGGRMDRRPCSPLRLRSEQAEGSVPLGRGCRRWRRLVLGRRGLSVKEARQGRHRGLFLLGNDGAHDGGLLFLGRGRQFRPRITMVTKEEAASTLQWVSCCAPPGRLTGAGAAQRGAGVDAAPERARGGVGAALDAAGGDGATVGRATPIILNKA